MNNKCIIKGCYRTANRNGLCLVCYNRAKKKVMKKETTWEKLEELGLCVQDGNPFDAAFDEVTNYKPREGSNAADNK